MDNRDKDFGYYTGWGVAYALVAGIFIYILWQGGAENWCAPEDNGSCFREWVGVLSGWAAAAVAVPSIFFLSRQIRTSDRQHQTALLMAMRPLHAAAWRVRELARIARNEASDVAERWADMEKIQNGKLGVVEQFRVDIANLRARIDTEDFRFFERSVLISPSMSSAGVISVFDRFGRFEGIVENRINAAQLPGVCAMMLMSVEQVYIFADACLQACDRIEQEVAMIAAAR
ncbi:hypothetical protein [Ensifer sp. LBL]|uniref:hypothetical protein n=1 Tax=Ensifer sp. LBL TaxID=2991056 RepID=UPI003D222AF5